MRQMIEPCLSNQLKFWFVLIEVGYLQPRTSSLLQPWKIIECLLHHWRKHIKDALLKWVKWHYQTNNWYEATEKEILLAIRVFTNKNGSNGALAYFNLFRSNIRWWSYRSNLPKYHFELRTKLLIVPNKWSYGTTEVQSV